MHTPIASIARCQFYSIFLRLAGVRRVETCDALPLHRDMMAGGPLAFEG